MQISRDMLLLVQPGFRDPAYPNRHFFCWHCSLIEGLLSSFPDLAKHLDVERIAWPRPRVDVISILGDKNQSLPILILKSDSYSNFQTESYEGIHFISDKDKILSALSERHGFPESYPG